MTERRATPFCPYHERTAERISDVAQIAAIGRNEIAGHEKDIKELYDKHSRVLDELSAAILKIDKMDYSLNNGWVERFNKIEKLISDQYEEYKRLCTKVDSEFEDIRKFKWFRDGVNKLRDSIFMTVIKIVLYLILVLGALHWADIGIKNVLEKVSLSVTGSAYSSTVATTVPPAMRNR